MPDIDVSCPLCGYSPVKHTTEQNDRAAAMYGEHAHLVCQATLPETREDVLDFFEVLGADEGCVFCPVCYCEFATERLRQGVLPLNVP